MNLHRFALPVGAGLGPPQQRSRDDVMALAKNIGPDLNIFAGNSFYRVAAAVDAGVDVFDEETGPGRIGR